MKAKTGGNGVKVAKLVQEVNAIISDVKLSYLQKCKLLSEIETDKRPGKQIADDLIFSFTKKKREYKKMNERIKDNRSSKSWAQRFLQRTKDEGYTASRQFCISDVSDVSDLKSLSYPHLFEIERYSAQLKERQKEIIFGLRKVVKEEKERVQKFIDFEKETGL